MKIGICKNINDGDGKNKQANSEDQPIKRYFAYQLYRPQADPAAANTEASDATVRERYRASRLVEAETTN